MTDKARFLKKYFCSLNFGPTGLNQAQDEFFYHFLEFGPLDFLETPYNDSLEQCLRCSCGKTHKIVSGAQIWAKQAKIEPKISFFSIFSSLVHYYSFKLYRTIAWNNI